MRSRERKNIWIRNADIDTLREAKVSGTLIKLMGDGSRQYISTEVGKCWSDRMSRKRNLSAALGDETYVYSAVCAYAY